MCIYEWSVYRYIFSLLIWLTQEECKLNQDQHQENILVGRKARILSEAGEVILNKINLTVMFQYSINWFKFLKSICRDLDKIIRDFFWSNLENVNSDRHKFIL